MKKELYVHIPTPCHENWHTMTPTDKGRSCQSCAKQVIDFSTMTDQQVLSYFANAAGNTCGRFSSEQLQRPLQPVREEKRKAIWIAAIMPMLMFFKKAEAQKAGNTGSLDSTEAVIKLDRAVTGMVDIVVVHHRKAKRHGRNKNNEATVQDKEALKYATMLTAKRDKSDPRFFISGRIVEQGDTSGVGFASVKIKGSKTTTVCDANGRFTVNDTTNENHAVLVVDAVGFEEKEVYVKFEDNAIVQKNNTRIINGIVTDADNGQELAGATVNVTGTNIATSTGVNGNFSLKIDRPVHNNSLVVSYVGYNGQEVTIPQNSNESIWLNTIRLKQDTTTLSDIVVGGYAIVCKKSKKRDLKKIDTIPAIIRKVFSADKFKIYPNPVPRGSSIHIEIKQEGSYSIQLFDNTGNLVAAMPFEASNNNLQATLATPSSVNAGTYYIRLLDNKKNKRYTDKIVVM